MAAKNKQDIEDDIKDLASIAEVAFKNISTSINDIFADALSSGDKVVSSLLKDMQRNVNSLAKESNNLIINQSRINKGLITYKDISKQLLNNEDKLYILEKQRLATIKSIEDETDKLITSSEFLKMNDGQKDEALEEQKKKIENINEQYAKAIDYNTVLVNQLKEQAEQTKLIEKRTGITAKALMGLKKIPILGDILNIDKGLENMRAKALKTGNVFEIMGSGIKGVFEGIEKASIILALFSAAKKIFDFIKDAMLAADERTTKLAKGLMISKDAARSIYSSFTDSKSEIDSIYRTTKDITEAFTDLTELTEFVTVSSMKMVEAQIILTKNLGLSKEQAFGVQEAFANSNIEADEGTDIIYDQIAAFANQNKLVSTGKAIFNDIAKTSKLIQVNFKGNLGALTKTTLEAKKLGLTLDQVSKIGGSLLNFEESISAELEAELLTGKDLNLEKARAYALNHDIAGLAQEITNQGFSQEEFANYNVIQQEAIAKAYGMQAEEMADMLYKAKILDKVGGQTLKNLRERADVLHEQGKETEEINLRNEIAQLEQGILSGKTLKQAEKANTAQEKFNQALEQAKEIFTDFITGDSLDKFADLLTKFVESVEIKGLGRTLIGGLADDEDIAEKRLGEQTKKLSTETDDEKRKQIQENINKLRAEIVEIKKEKKEKFREEAETDSTGIKTKVLRAEEAGFMTTGMEEKFAKGGIIVKPIHNATMGEAGPEAVIPLHRLPEMLNTNGTNDEAMNKMVALLAQQNSLLADIKDKKSYIGINGTVFGTTQENNSFVVS